MHGVKCPSSRSPPHRGTAREISCRSIASYLCFRDGLARVWEEKEDAVYWRGSGTGGHWHDAWTETASAVASIGSSSRTLFLEWHEDQLIRWVHYVPIGVGMEELAETTWYLFKNPEGQQIARRIAQNSQDWSQKVLREVDMSAALLRVLLEYNRLLQDDR
ncbi:hypothetical protein V500_00743 [Pseudogymnoascus sp. VKM F-4518 (FW-2643)]|nr:hypothetical protein V500_00743 [Pseudogymnoascus sp. VKM F-4518 (FW-2643)]